MMEQQLAPWGDSPNPKGRGGIVGGYSTHIFINHAKISKKLILKYFRHGLW